MENSLSTSNAHKLRGRRKTINRNPEESVRSVQRTYSILTAFTPDQPSATLSELARQSELPVSTVSRLLSTLESLSFVRRLSNGEYGLGVRMLQLGFAARQTFDIIDVSEPFLVELNRCTGENANLGVRMDEKHFTYVYQIESRHSVRHASWVGKTQPLKGTANGAALLGKTNADGYAATRKTIEADVSAVAAPVRSTGNEIVASISVAAPTYRVSDEQLAHYGALVVKIARRISDALDSS